MVVQNQIGRFHPAQSAEVATVMRALLARDVAADMDGALGRSPGRS